MEKFWPLKKRLIHSTIWAKQAYAQEIHTHKLAFAASQWTSWVWNSCHNELEFPWGNMGQVQDHTQEGACRMQSNGPSWPTPSPLPSTLWAWWESIHLPGGTPHSIISQQHFQQLTYCATKKIQRTWNMNNVTKY